MTRFNTTKENLTEFQEQVKLAQYLDYNNYCWIHVPNGGNRDAKTGAKMKKQGVKPGVPDVLIFDAYPLGFGIAIELKRKNGNPSDVNESQKEWLEKLSKRGWLTKVAFGADEAIDWLEELFEEGQQ